MALLTTVAAAVAVAEKTGLSSWLGRLVAGDKGEKVATQVMSIAQGMTGAGGPDGVLAALDADKELTKKVAARLQQNEQELIKLAFADLADARDTYERTDHKVADDLAKMVMRQNIWFVCLLIGANVGVVMLIENVGIVATISTLIGAAVNHFLGERLKVLSFHFGSSYGSKGKGEQQHNMMSQLTALMKKG